MSDFALTEAIINFAAGTEVNWNAFQIPIPANMVVYTIDTKKFKRGDGVRKYSELPPGPSIAGIIAGDQSVSTILDQLVPGDDDAVIVVDGDKYVASETKLTTLINRLNALASSDTTQSANITTISSQFGMVNTNITVGDNNKLVVTGNKKLSVGPTQESLMLQSGSKVITIRNINFYSDAACTKKVDSLEADTIYYAEVSCFHESIDIDSLSITLTENSSYITLVSLGHGRFRLVTTRPVFSGQVTFTATVAYNTDTVTVTKNVVLNAYSNIVMTVFGSAGNENLRNAAFGGGGNLYVVGYTQEGGANSYTGLLYKFDQALNVMIKKRFGSATVGESVIGVVPDAGGLPIIVGQSNAEGAGGSAFIVKISGASFGVINYRKYFNGAGNEQFNGVTTDASGNVFAIGVTYSDGDATNGSIFVAKFDTDCNLLALKKLNGSGVDYVTGIGRDNSGNIYVCGYTSSEGAGVEDALIVKFDNDLNQLACRRIGGAGNDRFFRIAINNSLSCVFAVGWSKVSGVKYEAILVKYDLNLSVLAKKKISFTDDLGFESVTYTYNNGIAISGSVKINGKNYGAVATFDQNLNLIKAKSIGSILGETYLHQFARTNPVTNDLVFGGETTVVNGTNDCFMVKFSNELPTGNFISTTIPSMEINDLALTVTDLTLTDAACSLSAQASALTLYSSTLLGVASSNLTVSVDNIRI